MFGTLHPTYLGLMYVGLGAKLRVQSFRVELVHGLGFGIFGIRALGVGLGHRAMFCQASGLQGGSV